MTGSSNRQCRLLSLLFLAVSLAGCTGSHPAHTDNAASKGTYAFVSLGCPKNLVDSERMLGLLKLDVPRF